MQVKTQLKYYIFSFIVLFTVFGTVLGKPNIPKSVITAGGDNLPTETKYHNLLTDKGAASNKGAKISYTACTRGFVLSNTHVLQTGLNFAGKKVQNDKDILLLISARHSNAVKVFNGNHIKFSDKLTHVFLFLFPYHSFW